MASLVKHVVLVKFNEDITAELRESLIQGFHALPGLIPDIKAFEWGTDVSVENRHQGFTHAFVLTFDSPEGRNAYLVHPSHEEFADKILAAVEKVTIFDYNPSPVQCQ
ncbi:hypothetical protein GOP47_0015572 [Adiantum capillus-veneris]|uniref:Stress-response A/B barrel domain-containing protein n=1 Tax=Adiantum capillus-veneris TaxID=13818 RepID=A0A9D4UKU7_ADICA|nr:hypothetical protein GOP47_0015572 [Adiantum capillus-veneris]